MKLLAPDKNITHVCLDGVYYPVRDGVVEVPAGRLAQELERLGYEPAAETPSPPPGPVFDADGLGAENVAPAPPAANLAPPPLEITKIQKTENRERGNKWLSAISAPWTK